MTTAILLHFVLGLASSFLGSLPFGTVNLSMIDTTVHNSFKAGTQLAIAAALVEIIQSFIAVHCGMAITDAIEMSPWIQGGVLTLILALGIFFLMKKEVNNSEQKSKFKVSNFVKGMILGLLNPQALPFWVFVVAYFHGTMLFQFEVGMIVSFLIGVSVGKLLALLLYGYLSLILIKRLTVVSKWMNKIIGGIFLAIGLVQGIRFFL